MTDAVVQLNPDGTGKNVDNESLAVGANTVYRQRVQIAGALAAEIARVLNTAPTGTEYAQVTRSIISGAELNVLAIESQKQTALLRSIIVLLSSMTNIDVEENDFLDIN